MTSPFCELKKTLFRFFDVAYFLFIPAIPSWIFDFSSRFKLEVCLSPPPLQGIKSKTFFLDCTRAGYRDRERRPLTFMPEQKTFFKWPQPEKLGFRSPLPLGIRCKFTLQGGGGGGCKDTGAGEGGDESFRSPPLLDATSAEPGCLISQHKSVTVICGGGGGRVLFPCSKSET